MAAKEKMRSAKWHWLAHIGKRSQKGMTFFVECGEWALMFVLWHVVFAPLGGIYFYFSKRGALVACRIKEPQMLVKYLTAREIGATDSDFNTPAVIAAISGSHECMHILIYAGADLDKGGDYGRTPLLWAILRSDERMARDLLNAGASPSQPDQAGMTPAMCAASNGHDAILRLLVDKGANLDAKSFGMRPETALDIARQTGEIGCEGIIEAALLMRAERIALAELTAGAGRPKARSRSL